jgi:hypothetical protein
MTPPVVLATTSTLSKPNTNAEPDHDPMETVITIAWND